MLYIVGPVAISPQTSLVSAAARVMFLDAAIFICELKSSAVVVLFSAIVAVCSAVVSWKVINGFTVEVEAPPNKIPLHDTSRFAVVLFVVENLICAPEVEPQHSELAVELNMIDLPAAVLILGDGTKYPLASQFSFNSCEPLFRIRHSLLSPTILVFLLRVISDDPPTTDVPPPSKNSLPVLRYKSVFSSSWVDAFTLAIAVWVPLVSLRGELIWMFVPS